MKRIVIITEISVLLLMFFALSGCGFRQEKAADPASQTTAEPTGQNTAELAGQNTAEPAGQNTDDAPPSLDTDDEALTLDALQGHWVDVNGDTTLDFAGDQMTIHWGSFEDLYTVGVTGTDRYGIVFNAEDRGTMRRA